MDREALDGVGIEINCRNQNDSGARRLGLAQARARLASLEEQIAEWGTLRSALLASDPQAIPNYEAAKYGKLVLIDAAGTSLTIAKTDFDDKTTIPFIKLNRQGSLRFRMLKKQGDGWQYAGDLRALSTIKVD